MKGGETRLAPFSPFPSIHHKAATQIGREMVLLRKKYFKIFSKVAGFFYSSTPA